MADILATLDVKSIAQPTPAKAAPSEPKAAPEKEAKMEPAKVEKEAKPVSKKRDLITEEEMNEILKKLEALEARIDKLEKQLAGGGASATTTTSDKPSIVKMLPYIVTCIGGSLGAWGKWHVAKLSNGKRYRMVEIRTGEGNFTVRQTRKVADRFGYKYDAKTKCEDLGWELVTKYGDGKYAFIGNKAVHACGLTYEISEIDTLYDKDVLRLATGEAVDNEGKPLLNKSYLDEPMKLDPKWTEEEIAEKLVDFYKSLHKKH